MEPVESIGDIPFRASEPLALLGLDAAQAEERDEPDADYYAYGHARVAEVWLDGDSGESARIDDALIIAIHAADDAPPQADDIELEFFIDEVSDDYSVLVPLSKFLTTWLPRLRGNERNIVLALCNPHGARLGLDAALDPGVPVHYPLGDTSSWIEEGDTVPRLAAQSWTTMERTS